MIYSLYFSSYLYNNIITYLLNLIIYQIIINLTLNSLIIHFFINSLNRFSLITKSSIYNRNLVLYLILNSTIYLLNLYLILFKLIILFPLIIHIFTLSYF